MTGLLMASAAASGYCGTLYPRWWHGPHPGPDPEPWYTRVIGLAVGLAVGYVATRVNSVDRGFTLVDVAATGLIAFAFAAVAADVVGSLGRSRSVPGR